MSTVARQKIFVDAIPLVAERLSGIGYAVLGLVSTLANDPEIQKHYEIVLVTPKRGLHLLDRWPMLAGCTRQGLPLRMRIIQGLMRVHMLPPMDLLLGRGIYLFGNFMNWRVTKKSVSFTYIHDVAFMLHPEFVSPKLQRMLQRKVPGFIKQTNYVVTVSESSKREVMEQFHVPASKMLVLHNGVNTDIYRPYAPRDVAAVKKRYDISGKYVLFVSSIEPRKNVSAVIETFLQLPLEYSLVLIGGSGWLNEAILKKIDEARAAGRKIIKPEIYVPNEDVGPLMSGAELLLHPAFHEGFGMTPLEAMAAESPVVVSDIPSLREVVGDAGVYCDPHDVDSIVAAVRRTLDLPPAKRQALVKKGRRRAAQFSWQSTAHTFYAFLRKQRILEQRP